VSGQFVDRAVAPEVPDVTERSPWTFLSNNLHVLACIYRDPAVRLRDVATMVGITERAAQSMVADLAHAGYLTRLRVGRRNHYEVHRSQPLRHRLDTGLTIGMLLDVVLMGQEPNGANGANGHTPGNPVPVADVG
jgi:hypothetical protein